MNDTVGLGGVVGHRLEGVAMQGGVEPLAEPVHGLAGGQVGDDYLLELSDGGASDGLSTAYRAVDGIESRQVFLQDVQQVVEVARAGLRDVRRLEAMLDEGSSLDVVQPVEAFDNAGLDGPRAVECRRVCLPTWVCWSSHCWSSSSSDKKSCSGCVTGVRWAASVVSSCCCVLLLGHRPCGGCPSEVGGYSSFGLGGFVHAGWALGGADVAESALLAAGYPSRRFVG